MWPDKRSLSSQLPSCSVNAVAVALSCHDSTAQKVPQAAHVAHEGQVPHLVETRRDQRLVAAQRS